MFNLFLHLFFLRKLIKMIFFLLFSFVIIFYTMFFIFFSLSSNKLKERWNNTEECVQRFNKTSNLLANCFYNKHKMFFCLFFILFLSIFPTVCLICFIIFYISNYIEVYIFISSTVYFNCILLTISFFVLFFCFIINYKLNNKFRNKVPPFQDIKIQLREISWNNKKKKNQEKRSKVLRKFLKDFDEEFKMICKKL